MTPVAHTLYSIALFLALAALWMWSKRKNRVTRMVRRAVSTLAKNGGA